MTATASPLRVLVFPRDANPYQSRLYEALDRAGVRARYVGDLTPSHTVNLLILPVELLVWRLRGVRLLHLHWVFGFAVTGAAHNPGLRWASYAWYLVVLACARLAGIHIVWTLHNVLPHEQVFPDDTRARRLLLRAASLVIAHTPQALTELGDTVAAPRRAIVVPHPAFSGVTAIERHPGDPRRLLLFGRITAYKGVEETIAAFEQIADATTLELTVAGECPEPELRRHLNAFSERHPGRIHLRLDHVPEAELVPLFAGHDLQWLPYRRSTTSGAAILGASMGMPLAVPQLPCFEDVPGVRLGHETAALAAALRELDVISEQQLAELSTRSIRWCTQLGSWDDMARATRGAMLTLAGVGT